MIADIEELDEISPGRDRRLRPSTLIRDHPERGQEQEGESYGLSSPNPLQDNSTRDDAEAKNDFWFLTRGFIYRHHVEPRVNPVHAERRIISSSDEVHHNNICVIVWKNLLMITGTWMEKENYQMH